MMSRVAGDGLFDAAEEPDAPPVLQPEHVQEDPEPGPPVYVPIKSYPTEAASLELELRHTEDDQLALIFYSDQQALIECCGDAQPWLAVPREQVEALAEHAGAEVIAYDVELDEGLQRHSDDEGSTQ